MITFDRLSLTNYVLFDKAELQLDYQGLTVINGKNLKAKSDNRSNGSGKSLLMSSISNLLYGLSTPTTPVKSRSKKDTFYRKDTRVELTLKQNSDQYKIAKYNKGQTLKYDIEKNSKSMEFTTARASEKWLSEFLPMSEDTFFSTVYLDSRRPNLSLIGSGANRFDYFCSLFNLDVYDNIRQHFVESKKSLQMLQIRKEEIDKQLYLLQKKKKELKKIIGKKDHNWIKEQAIIVERQSNDQFRIASALPIIKKLQDAHSETYNKKEYETLQKQLVKVVFDLKQIQDFEYQNKEYKTYTKKLYKLNQKQKTFPKTKKVLNLQQTKIDMQQAKIIQTTRSKLLKKLQKITKPKNIDDMGQKIVEIVSKISVQKLQLSKLSKVKDKGQCPTCGSSIDTKKIQKSIKTLIDSIAKMTKKQTKQKVLSKKAKIWKEYQEALQKLPKTKSFASLKTKYKTQRIQQKNQQKFDQIQYQIQKLIKIKKPKSAKFLDQKHTLTKKKKGLDSRLAILLVAKSTDKSMESLKNLGFDNIKDVKKLQQDVSNFDTQKLRSKIQVITTSLDRMIEGNKLEESLNQKLQKYDKRLDKLDTINALVKAYSNSGLKRFACATLAKQVEENLNNLASLVFDQDFRFVLDVTPTDFLVLYEDARGRFDVRNLSGAESRLFTILSMLAILPLLPSNRRTNLLILDEMTVNLDPTNIDRFVNGLVPALLEIIPSVIMISNEPIFHTGARQIQIERNEDCSKLIHI